MVAWVYTFVKTNRTLKMGEFYVNYTSIKLLFKKSQPGLCPGSWRPAAGTIPEAPGLPSPLAPHRAVLKI